MQEQERTAERGASSIGSVNYIGGGNRPKIERVRLQTDVSNGRELALVVDTGADIRLLKPDILDKTRRFEPDNKVKVKSVNGSVIEILGTVKTVAKADFWKMPFMFHLVNKQVDVPCDGITGRDFFERSGAQICYATRTLRLGTGSDKVSKALLPLSTEGLTRAIRRLVLPSRTELVVRLPVKVELCSREGITAKQEIQAALYLAGAMNRVHAGYAITSIAHTNSEDVEIDEAELEVTAIDAGTDDSPGRLTPTSSEKELPRGWAC